MASIDFVNMDFIVTPLPGDGGGYSWSLTTLLGELLDTAERLYGPRDRTWTPLGVEFSEDGPTTWYPGNRRQVSILLSLNARTNAHAAIFELAHETIHLLAPTGRPNQAPVLEEGVAVLFSDMMAQEWKSTCRSYGASYLHAARCVQALLDLYPAGIPMLRQVEPCFARMTAGLITEVLPDVPATLAAELVAPFIRTRAAGATNGG